jgi:hypothetical protein
MTAFEKPSGPNLPDEPHSLIQPVPLIEDNIESRAGNYLLSFGFPGSGKSTFQSFLYHYLVEVGSFETQPQIDGFNETRNWDGLRLVNEWRRLWHQREFPARTAIGEENIREILLRVRPMRGVQTELNFGLLEVSGELMQTVMPGETRDPSLARTLQIYLDNPQIHFVVVFIVDPARGRENDILFDNFFRFLDLNFPQRRNQMALALLISRPEVALNQLKREVRGLEHAQRLTPTLCLEYAQRYIPGTFRVWDTWPMPSRVMLSSLYLGSPAADGQRLERPDYSDIEQIFAWLYHQFTASHLGPTWWQRILQWFRT